jgi:hypothetical protein
VQGRQSAARRQRQDEAGCAQQRVDPRARVGQRVVLVNQPAGITEQQREQERRPPEQEQEKGGQPRAYGADPVGNGPGLTGIGEAGIPRVVADECEEQQQRERAERPERALTQTARDRGRQLRRGLRTAGRGVVG